MHTVLFQSFVNIDTLNVFNFTDKRTYEPMEKFAQRIRSYANMIRAMLVTFLRG